MKSNEVRELVKTIESLESLSFSRSGTGRGLLPMNPSVVEAIFLSEYDVGKLQDDLNQALDKVTSKWIGLLKERVAKWADDDKA